MKNLLLFCCFGLSLTLSAQSSFKELPAAKTLTEPIRVEELQFSLPHPGLPSAQPTLLHSSALHLWSSDRIGLPKKSGVKVTKDPETGQVIYLSGRPADLPPARPDKTDAYAYLAAVAEDLGIENPYAELILSDPVTDELGQVHVRVKQQFAGLPLFPADAWIHASSAAGFDRLTGHLLPTPQDVDLRPTKSANWAENRVKAAEASQYVPLSESQMEWISGPQMEVELALYSKVASPVHAAVRLVYYVESRPNLAEHNTTILNAHTGEVLKQYSHICGFAGKHLHEHSGDHPIGEDIAPVNKNASFGPQLERAHALPPDGPYTTTQQNLYDQFETINTFSISDTYFLLDGSREMFINNNGEIDGLIFTYDGLSGSPQLSGFDPQLATSLNNTDWTRTEVSVHSNAGAAYQYFLDRHQRNSIDGEGGNVFSFFNINETDGTQMDNAFWNGRALFYGNGAQAFSRLPRALDVAGHEMAHGVIQATADLIYEEQPGALNESFADIFGYLVEGETGDFRIGEDVVNPSVFTSGTMRNMQSPNNGAAGPQDFRWQPAHMDEYQNLPVNAQNDNGGVHINSGIPNRAFYLFASDPAVGDTRAEKVYYRALAFYLTRSSRFADVRIAVVMAAQDLYGANVVAAANSAFDQVGIGGDGGDYTVDLESNAGDRFILISSPDQDQLYLTREDGTILNNPLANIGHISKPSITDDGTFAVFVDDQGRLRVYNFNTNQLGFIESNPGTNWRNIAISKDGNRIAVTTSANDNQVIVFDLVSGTGTTYTFFNPTTAQGISTGDVITSDALEFDASGEVLMYDAQSQLDDGLTFWDIGFMQVWDNANNTFGDGRIVKLVSTLPDGVSIGNPTFSKNSPYIIAFEEVDFTSNTFDVIGANIETGQSNTIFRNAVVNYPNYGVADDRMIFDVRNSANSLSLAVVPLAEDKISAAGNPGILFSQAHWGIYFANGERDLDVGIEGPILASDELLLYPTVTRDQVFLERKDGKVWQGETTQVLDLLGRSKRQLQLSGSGRQQLSLAGLPSGTYLLVVTLEAGTVVQRVIKQ
ncbi:MAG: M4 family metallopeptidase [Bacteroidota bacterium]